MFIVHLHRKGLRATTIRSYLSAIGFIHRLNQLQDPTQSLLVTKTMHGIFNQEVIGHSTALQPITRTILHRMLDTLPQIQPNAYYCTLLGALYLLAYHACMRAGEAVTSSHDHHTLDFCDLKPTFHLNKPAYAITFSSFKHSRTPTNLILPSASSPRYCPVHHLKKYIRLRGSTPGKLFINITGQPIDRHFFAYHLKTSIAHLGMSPDLYNTHSFRIGRATQLATDHTPDNIIRSVGRWRSSAYQSYIRPHAINLPQ